MSGKQRIVLLALMLSFTLLAFRQHQFVDRYSVDVLYWDSWDLYHPLFAGQGWWTSFDFQHGPHRQGVGGLLMRILARNSQWNSRWDAFSVSFTLMIAALLGIVLAFRCGVRGWALLIVPPIYLNIRQYHMFIASANPAHGALPVLMLTGYCLAFFIWRNVPRLAIQTALTFLLIFTGFGIFVGLIAPVILLIELIHLLRSSAPQRRGRMIAVVTALVAIAFSWARFAWGYHFDPAADGFRFPYEHPVEYLYFIGAMLGNYFGLNNATASAVVVGLLLFTALIGICVLHLVRLIKASINPSPRDAVQFCLTCYVLIFSVHSAIGRTFLGWQTGSISRYVTLMIPMGLALLIELATKPALARRGIPLIYGGLFLLGTLTLPQSEIDAARYLHNKCLDWRLAYLQTHDQAAADQLTQFPIHPKSVGNRLHYLRVLKLNLFDPDAFKEDARIREP